jgi:chromosomal replication initiation ATPase DnaA
MNIPRFSPVDTSVVQRMMSYRKNNCASKLEQIRRAVMKVQGIDPLEQNQCRNGELVQARQLFVAMMVRHTRMTYQTIADIIGKDHSTISHSIKTVKDLRFTDKNYETMYKMIDNEIKNY